MTIFPIEFGLLKPKGSQKNTSGCYFILIFEIVNHPSYEPIIRADTVKKIAEESLEVDLSELDVKTMKNAFFHGKGCNPVYHERGCCRLSLYYGRRHDRSNKGYDDPKLGWTTCLGIVSPINENEFTVHYTKYVQNQNSNSHQPLGYRRGAKIFSNIDEDMPSSMFSNLMIAKHLPQLSDGLEYLSYGEKYNIMPMSKHLLYGMTNLKILELIKINVHLTSEYFISNVNLESIIIYTGDTGNGPSLTTFDKDTFSSLRGHFSMNLCISILRFSNQVI